MRHAGEGMRDALARLIIGDSPEIERLRQLILKVAPSRLPVLVEGPRFVLSRTPGHVRGPGPVYGQHTDEVLALLGGRHLVTDVTDTQTVEP